MQSERIFQQEDGRWYFRIRGNTSMGPYSQPSRSERQPEPLRRVVPPPVRNELHVAALAARAVTSRAASTNTAPAAPQRAHGSLISIPLATAPPELDNPKPLRRCRFAVPVYFARMRKFLLVIVVVLRLVVVGVWWLLADANRYKPQLVELIHARNRPRGRDPGRSVVALVAAGATRRDTTSTPTGPPTPQQPMLDRARTATRRRCVGAAVAESQVDHSRCGDRWPAREARTARRTRELDAAGPSPAPRP